MKTHCHTSITMISVRTKVGNENCAENVYHEHLTKTINLHENTLTAGMISIRPKHYKLATEHYSNKLHFDFK